MLFLGIDNPITFAVEKISNDELILKTDNGMISISSKNYSIKPDRIGDAVIFIYKKEKSILKLIAQKSFSVKMIAYPEFKIASGRKRMPAIEVSSQLYVRAELQNIDFDARAEVDEFTVEINYKDSSHSVTYTNISNKLSLQIINAFKLLKKDDVLFFTDIYATTPWKKHMELDPVTILIR